MRMLLFTDAWLPQVNGVVRTWTNVANEAAGLGHELEIMHPGAFATVPTPGYPEIRLAVNPLGRVSRRIRGENREPFDAIHIATEGPIGLAARHVCRRAGLRYTTSYHTQFPQYLKAYYRLPEWSTYTFVKWFHGASHAVLVPTETVRRELAAKGIRRVVTWRRGVDMTQFKPRSEAPAFRPRFEGLPRPIFLNAGRVAAEKNIEAFCRLDLPGTRVVVGDGPAFTELSRRYPEVHWAGYQHGDDLADHYRDADVFVFPSRTDTYGNVMLEANACGLPVAAYPVTGPIDVVRPGVTGVLSEDLAAAAIAARDIDPAGCIAHARDNTWARCAAMVFDHAAVD